MTQNVQLILSPKTHYLKIFFGTIKHLVIENKERNKNIFLVACLILGIFPNTNCTFSLNNIHLQSNPKYTRILLLVLQLLINFSVDSMYFWKFLKWQSLKKAGLIQEVFTLEDYYYFSFLRLLENDRYVLSILIHLWSIFEDTDLIKNTALCMVMLRLKALL